MITVTDWTRAARVGGPVVATFDIASSRTVASVALDLIGDGASPLTVAGVDGLRALGMTATRAGTFRVQLSVTDTQGCTDTTAAARMVTVTR